MVELKTCHFCVQNKYKRNFDIDNGLGFFLCPWITSCIAAVHYMCTVIKCVAVFMNWNYPFAHSFPQECKSFICTKTIIKQKDEEFTDCIHMKPETNTQTPDASASHLTFIVITNQSSCVRRFVWRQILRWCWWETLTIDGIASEQFNRPFHHRIILSAIIIQYFIKMPCKWAARIVTGNKLATKRTNQKN